MFSLENDHLPPTLNTDYDFSAVDVIPGSPDPDLPNPAVPDTNQRLTTDTSTSKPSANAPHTNIAATSNQTATSVRSVISKQTAMSAGSVRETESDVDSDETVWSGEDHEKEEAVQIADGRLTYS